MSGLLLIVVVLCGAALGAQRGFFLNDERYEALVQNAKYDGRFTFARLRYTVGPGGYYYCGMPAWGHGYFPSCRGGGQRAETNLMKIMNEVSYLNPHIEDSVVLGVDDPRLAKYPIAYMTEAGYWEMTDQEGMALRAYLLKGGFVIFDDFRDPPRGGGGWDQLEENMRRVLPDLRWTDLDPADAIFDSFFKIGSFTVIPQMYDQGRPVLRGLFENNDRGKRLIAIANFNTDISDFWEFSATGFRPVDESNEAYKLGVNYVMYGLTH